MEEHLLSCILTHSYMPGQVPLTTRDQSLIILLRGKCLTTKLQVEPTLIQNIVMSFDIKYPGHWIWFPLLWMLELIVRMESSCIPVGKCPSQKTRKWVNNERRWEEAWVCLIKRRCYWPWLMHGIFFSSPGPSCNKWWCQRQRVSHSIRISLPSLVVFRHISYSVSSMRMQSSQSMMVWGVWSV